VTRPPPWGLDGLAEIAAVILGPVSHARVARDRAVSGLIRSALRATRPDRIMSVDVV
jgi:hypothetical protein